MSVSSGPVEIEVDLSDVRPVGETLKGFGGMANPVKLKEMYGRGGASAQQGTRTSAHLR